jgi:hypothetical protein
MQNPQAGLTLFLSRTSYLNGARGLPDANYAKTFCHTNRIGFR